MVTSVTLRGEYRSCARTLDFGLLFSPTDKNIPVINIPIGVNISVFENEENVFTGVVWNKAKASGGKEITIHCKDYGVYLVKNKVNYNFLNIAPEDIVSKVCSDLGIATGTIAKTGVPINRIFLSSTVYDVIMTAYTLSNDKKYMILFSGNKLNVLEKELIQALPLESGANLLTASVAESLDSMVNSVSLFSEDGILISTFKTDSEIEQYGKLGDVVKMSNSTDDYTLTAKAKLKGLDRKISVTNFGDIGYTTGKCVSVVEPVTNLKGTFYIDSDEHNWKNNIYTNSLVLNFENISDEKEGGNGEQS